ncbi:putative HTH transcriptional regulator [Clostridium punense]|uniref:HTH transcriptional regulator n=1 Tax=Clostridium punense TaxID=1054297 RepID=A0ABS4K050_9CLOT|nr:RNA-binding domain-containing protein [Clostridium punense]MBP2021159.1 putative HTH transcriptional regulator [Clostridium punense]
MNLDIYSLAESDEIECKDASGGLPKDLWESYSAFANTNGGTILLGIQEKSNKFYVTGVDNPDHLIKDFWDNINNPKKVSANILSNENVELKVSDEKSIIKITIPRADRKQRPVYIGENPFNEGKHSGVFRRNYSGDYKCSREEITRMLADQTEESQDSKILEGFDIDDLNEDSIKSFRNRLSAVKPDHPWISLDTKTFLYKLGAYGKDRKTSHEGVTVAGLLMFGEERAIIDEFPKYFLDYREKYSEDIRWEYRVISSEGTWSGNIFDFYYKVINKIVDNINVPFRVINGTRQDDTRVHKAIREAVANALIHADYRVPRGIVIEKGKTYFKFSNPGTLRVSREEALKGGVSDPRNENIFKMFNLLGIGERAGSGLENIQLAWKEQKWIAPDLEEEYNPDRINLILRTVSMLPMKSVELLKEILEEEYEQLNKDEVMALITAHQEGYVTNYRLQQLIDTHAINSNKVLSLLVEKGYLESDGIGRGTRYYLAKNFKIINEHNINKADDKKNQASEENKESDSTLLNNDEVKVINFIKKNGYINNSLSRETLGYTKHQSVILFNSLIEKGLIEKKGKSSSTTYQLKKI